MYFGRRKERIACWSPCGSVTAKDAREECDPVESLCGGSNRIKNGVRRNVLSRFSRERLTRLVRMAGKGNY